jgi:hypothetical protein
MGLLQVLGLTRRTAVTLPANGSNASGPPPARGSAPQGDGDADLQRKVNLAKKLIVALGLKYDEHVAKAQKDIDAQPVPALKARLTGEIDTLRASRAEIDTMEPQAGADRMRKVSSQAHILSLRTATMLSDGIEGAREVEDWGVKPLEALKKQVAALTGDAKALFSPRIPILEGRLAQARVVLDKGDFEELIRVAGPLKHACDAASEAIRNFATDYPEYTAYRRRVEDMLKRMRDKGLLDADGQKTLVELQAAIGASDALGPIRGYKAALAALKRVAVRAKVLRDSNEAYVDYKAAREQAGQEVAALEAHKQAARIKSEIADLDDRLKEADKLAKESEGGSLKALTALTSVRADVVELRKLGDDIGKAEARLPELKKKLAAGGVDKKKMEKVANVALKLLVEESCTDDEAVKMAKDATGYVDEGLEERDAIMSSRVKSSLEKEGISPARAKAVGKNIRSGGTSSAEDAKVVASNLAKLSPKVIDSLNKANIHTECCRGGITDAMPELAGVLPRGWHETTTWDQVEGVYSPNNKKLVVGTDADATGKRTIPLKLVGHEAGHAFDDSDNKPKRENKDFLAARDADILAAKVTKANGMFGPRDNYFLTEGEGGTNTKGAISETFADSFARHATGNADWPKLKAFWAANPWGI